MKLSKSARDYIVSCGYDHNFGARPLKRFLVKNVESLLARALVEGSLKPKDNVTVSLEDNKLVLIKE